MKVFSERREPVSRGERIFLAVAPVLIIALAPLAIAVAKWEHWSLYRRHRAETRKAIASYERIMKEARDAR